MYYVRPQVNIDPIWSLLISCLALAVSFSGLYFSHLRRTRKAFASALWCKREGDNFVLEASISNQGNRQITVSRIWLLSPLKGNSRTRYECQSINQAAPLKVQPMSAEFLCLSFPSPEGIKLHGMYPTMEPASVTYELLFYVTDDRGIEHYAQMPAVTLTKSSRDIEVMKNSVRLVPGKNNSEKNRHAVQAA